LRIAIIEISQPLAVRRTVSFAEAVYAGAVTVEGLTARLVERGDDLQSVLGNGEIPVLVDPELETLADINPTVLVDARMLKRKPETGIQAAPLVVGLGPGFTAGENCHAVVETMRGHNLGRVFWEGRALPDTGVPGSIARHGLDRVLRAPADGVLQTHVEIGASLQSGGLIATVGAHEVRAPFKGLVRGLLRHGFPVHKGLKIGDLDPRNDPSYCWLVSDKALAVGGGVLEAVLSKAEMRAKLYSS
jgi:xanthine dehydrogenase accessory factor